MTTESLKLFWWKKVPNFGDALSQLVVAHASGREVVHAGPGQAEMFALGSLMRLIRRNRAHLARPVIWGTGMLGPVQADFLDSLDIRLLRGPIGAALLGVSGRRFGDPGLLAADALGPAPTRRDRIGLILHHAQAGDPRAQALAAQEPRVELIDVAEDCRSVSLKIASCAHVVSSSLHGLIVADAYGVANTWLDTGGHGQFKYYDYAASIGRALPPPVSLDELGKIMGRLRDAPLTYTDGIDAAKSALYDTFPAEMRAVAAPAMT